MKTATQNLPQRSISKRWISLGRILRELAPIIIPSVLLSICIYCCIMETITFTPSHTLRPSPINTKILSTHEIQAPNFNNTYYNR